MSASCWKKNWQRRRTDEANANAYVISFALCEATGIFGLLDHFVTGSHYYCIAFAVAAVGMLLHFPKKDHVRAAMYQQF